MFCKGEIQISPKKFYWIQMPDCIQDNDKIEMLKKDILLINYKGSILNVTQLKSHADEYSSFFYNLDKIIDKHIEEFDDEFLLYLKISTIIKSLGVNRSLVHTRLIDNNISKYFKKEGILYLEKNLNFKRTAISTVYSLIDYLTSKNNNLRQRSSVRLFMRHLKFETEVSLDTGENQYFMKGILNDLSINGLSLILENKNDLEKIELKNIVKLRLVLKSHTLVITQAIAVRKNIEKNELGVSFNINDNKMIRDDYAFYLTEVIYSWLKEILAENENIIN